MPLSNAEKQRRHRERLQRQGLVHIQGWVTQAQAKLIKKIIAGEIRSGKQLVTSNRTVKLEPFAKRVQETAETVQPGKRRGLAVGRFSVGSSGKGKRRSLVFIAAVWRELRSDPLYAGMSLDKFKEELLRAYEAGLVTLCEATARSVLDPEELRESEARGLKGTFHFIESRGGE
jgi:hypothetical protein